MVVGLHAVDRDGGVFTSRHPPNNTARGTQPEHTAGFIEALRWTCRPVRRQQHAAGAVPASITPPIHPNSRAGPHHHQQHQGRALTVPALRHGTRGVLVVATSTGPFGVVAKDSL